MALCLNPRPRHTEVNHSMGSSAGNEGAESGPDLRLIAGCRLPRKQECRNSEGLTGDPLGGQLVQGTLGEVRSALRDVSFGYPGLDFLWKY